MIRWQRAIVEVRWARAPVRKVVIEPGGTLSIGRSERADLAIPDDRTLSARHCEIQWDGETCRVVDLGSREGTFLGGERVERGEVKNGGFLRVGATVVSIYLEGATPPRKESGLRGDGTDVLGPEQEAALAALLAEPAPLFAVLDAARGPRVLEVLRESVEPYRSLYEGIKGEALAEWAPHLARVPRGSRLLEQLVLEGWGRRWGIYLACRRPFDEVRTQLRRVLMVGNEQSGQPMYFRFYDPRILRVTLPTCSTRQKQQLFGEIEAFLVEGRRGEVLRLTPGEAAAALTAPREADPGLGGAG